MEELSQVSKTAKNETIKNIENQTNVQVPEQKPLVTDFGSAELSSRSASGRLEGEVMSQEKLTLQIKNQLWNLYSFYYDDTHYETFILDLHEKNFVCLLRDSGNKVIKGFSTIKVYKKSFGKKVINVVFSGDTIVDSQYWGQRSLSTELFKFFMKLKLKNPTTPVYWFLISKGYKTYLGMTRNFINYWPRYDKPTPQLEKQIIDMLARDKYQDCWRPDLGLLKFEKCPGKLKSTVAPIDAQLLNDPDVRFFNKINPEHAEGDELCCLAQVNLALAFYYPYRVVKKLFLKSFRNLGFGRKLLRSK